MSPEILVYSSIDVASSHIDTDEFSQVCIGLCTFVDSRRPATVLVQIFQDENKISSLKKCVKKIIENIATERESYLIKPECDHLACRDEKEKVLLQVRERLCIADVSFDLAGLLDMQEVLPRLQEYCKQHLEWRTSAGLVANGVDQYGWIDPATTNEESLFLLNGIHFNDILGRLDQIKSLSKEVYPTALYDYAIYTNLCFLCKSWALSSQEDDEKWVSALAISFCSFSYDWVDRHELLFQYTVRFFREQVETNDDKWNRLLNCIFECAETIVPSQLRSEFFRLLKVELVLCNTWLPDRYIDLNTMGYILRELIQIVENEKDRRAYFRDLVTRVFSNRMNYDLAEVQSKLFRLTDELNIPTWAIDSLPGLPVTWKEDTRFAYVWVYLVLCIPKDYEYSIEKSLCNGQIAYLSLSPEAAAFIRKISPIFTSELQTHCDPSNRAMAALALSAIDSIQIYSHPPSRSSNVNSEIVLNNQEKKAVESAHEKIVQAVYSGDDQLVSI